MGVSPRRAVFLAPVDHDLRSEVSGRLDQASGRPLSALPVGPGGRFVAVPGSCLHSEQRGEIPGPVSVGLGQERHGFVVVVASSVLAEPGAADDVGGGDPGVDSEGCVRVGDNGLVVGEGFDRLRCGPELLRFGQPPGSRGVGASDGSSHDPTSRRCFATDA